MEIAAELVDRDAVTARRENRVGGRDAGAVRAGAVAAVRTPHDRVELGTEAERVQREVAGEAAAHLDAAHAVPLMSSRGE